MFIVMRKVSGGVTGTRKGPVYKDKAAGELMYFKTEADAKTYAAKLNGQSMMCNHHAWVKEVV